MARVEMARFESVMRFSMSRLQVEAMDWRVIANLLRVRMATNRRVCFGEVRNS